MHGPTWIFWANLRPLSPKVAGGLKGSPGAYTGAEALFGFYAVSKNMMFTAKDGRTMDPVNEEWEKQALCKIGIGSGSGSGGKAGDGCPGHALLNFKAMFARSFSDSFGDAIRGDLAALIIAYYLMVRARLPSSPRRRPPPLLAAAASPPPFSPFPSPPTTPPPAAPRPPLPAARSLGLCA